MSYYGDAAATAARMIAKRGRVVGLKRTVQTHAAASGVVNDDTPLEGTLNALTLPASKGTIEAFDNRLEGGTLIDEKLRFVLAAALGAPFEPQSNDYLTFDGHEWLVLGCTPLNPGGVSLLYKMGVKRV